MTKSTLIALPIRGSAPTITSGAIALGVALAAAPTAALAAAQVRGNPEAVTVEAKNNSVEEILAALSGTFDVHYRSSANLQTRLTGNYEGSLRRVMKRVLDGYSYFVKTDEGRVDITVLDTPRTALETGDAPPVRVVGRPQDAVSAQPPQVVAAAESPVIPGSPTPPSTETSPSAQVAEPAPYPPPPAAEASVAQPAQPTRTANVVDPHALPASPATPSSRKRDHVLAAGGKELRPPPPRRIKIASGRHRWKKSHHARQTRLAHAALCSRRIRAFDSPMMIPVSSYYWLESEQVRLRSLRNCAQRRYARSQRD